MFVYVKDGLGSYCFDVPTESVKLDQKGCRYTPHVLGVRAGQPLDIANSDDTLHNVHAMAKANSEFNIGQAIKDMKDDEDVHARGGDGAVQMRRARLDERLCRRASIIRTSPSRTTGESSS